MPLNQGFLLFLSHRSSIQDHLYVDTVASAFYLPANQERAQHESD